LLLLAANLNEKTCFTNIPENKFQNNL